MDTRNPILLPTSFLFLLLVVLSTSCSAFPLAKPGCEDRCGSMSIPFPFGTRGGCYLNSEFFINCSKYMTPFLGASEIEVTDISVEGQIRILHYIGYNCHNPRNDSLSRRFEPWILLSNAFAFNNTANKFTTIGCDTYSTVRGRTSERVYETGCVSICDCRENVLGGSCSGNGCCQTSIPNSAWQINVTVNSFDNHSSVWDFNPCSYGFVVEESTFQFFAENLTNIDKDSLVPVVVDWAVEFNVNCKRAKLNPSSYACTTKYSECVDQPGAIGYRCKCVQGFYGNPYLPNNGCRDIDECASPKLNKCTNHSVCYNTWGSYKCNCNQGYHSNNGKNGWDQECILDAAPDKKLDWPIFTVLGTCSIVIVLFYIWYSRLMMKREHSTREKHFRKNGGFLLKEKLSVSQRENNNSVRIFTYMELKKATNNFDSSQIIGHGCFGTVYKGELTDNTIAAIKKSRGVDHRNVEQFINEVILLSRINNKNVVRLLGCCLETEIPLLVYEFVNNGTLFEHLKDMIRNHGQKLSWNIRMQIASQVSEVLFYLHSHSPQIIHKDIKSSNILLDQNYMAKVADIGISQSVPIVENQFSTMVQGTLGYLDPEYLQNGILTEKSDVYSFGVVLIELLTGKKVFSAKRPEAEKFLANHFRSHLNDDNLVGVLDHNYDISNFELIKEVAMIAKRCTSAKAEDRPHMKEVSKDLEILEKKFYNVSKALEIASKEYEGLVGNQQTSACSSSDGHTSTYSFGDLYPTTSTTMKPMVPIDGEI